MSLPIVHLAFCRWLAPALVGLWATAAPALPVAQGRESLSGRSDAAAAAPAPALLSRHVAWVAGRLASASAFGPRIAAGGAALGQDLSRLRAGPLAPLAPLMPLSRIRVIDLDRPLPGLRLGEVLSPGGWAGRYVLGQVRGDRVIEFSGWWGSALLPLGRGGAAGDDAPGLAGAADRPDRIGALPEPGRRLMPGPGRDAGSFLPRDGGPGRLPAVIKPAPVASAPGLPEVPTPVPLPGAMVLLGGAIAALALIRRQRRPGGPPF